MKLSKLAHVALNINFDSYKQLDKLHARYGDFVRTGTMVNRNIPTLP